MSIEGYVDYKRREFCNNVTCDIQMQLNAAQEESDDYEKIRTICKEKCKYTAYQFHQWLIEQGYLVIREEQ